MIGVCKVPGCGLGNSGPFPRGIKYFIFSDRLHIDSGTICVDGHVLQNVYYILRLKKVFNLSEIMPLYLFN
jgi:hypothetical protein